MTTKYKYAFAPDHPLANAKGIVPVHRRVLYDQIGPGEHHCHWCQRVIYWRSGEGDDAIEPDHLDGNKGNNDPSNLVPSCHRCNGHRSNYQRISDDELSVVVAGVRRRAVYKECAWCGEQFVVPKITNDARYCSTLCRQMARGLPRHLSDSL